MPNLLNQQNQQAPQNASPNLASDVVYSPERLQAIRFSVKLSEIVLVVIEIAATAVILANYKLGADIRALDVKINKTNEELLTKADTEKLLLFYQNKINDFKTIKTINPLIQKKIKLIYEATPGDVVIQTLEFNKNTLTLKLSAPNAIPFAKLVNAYIKTNKVEQVALNSAVLNTTTSTYDFGIDVEIKEAI